MAARRQEERARKPLRDSGTATLPIHIRKGRSAKTNAKTIKRARSAHIADLLRQNLVHSEAQTAQDYDWLADPEFKGKRKLITAEDIDRMIQRLSPRQGTYALARLWGMGRLQAGRQVSADKMTTLQWEKTPWWPVLVRRERDRAFGQKTIALDPLVPIAVARMRDALIGNYGNEIAVDMAKYIFDHRFGKATQHTTVEGDAPQANVAQAFVDLVRSASEANRALIEQNRALNPPKEVEVIQQPPEDDDDEYGGDTH